MQQRNDPFSKGSRLSYRRENNLPAPYETYTSSTRHEPTRESPSTGQSHRYTREQLQMREDHFKIVDGHTSDSNLNDSVPREKPHGMDKYPTYEGISRSHSTFQAQSSSMSRDIKDGKPNHKRSVKRQSQLINSAESGYKFFRGFIGSHNQRP